MRAIGTSKQSAPPIAISSQPAVFAGARAKHGRDNSDGVGARDRLRHPCPVLRHSESRRFACLKLRELGAPGCDVDPLQRQCQDCDGNGGRRTEQHRRVRRRSPAKAIRQARTSARNCEIRTGRCSQAKSADHTRTAGTAPGRCGARSPKPLGRAVPRAA